MEVSGSSKSEIPWLLFAVEKFALSVTVSSTSLLFNSIPSAWAVAEEMVKRPLALGLIWKVIPVYGLVIPLVISSVPVSRLGPLMMIKSFKLGGTICRTSAAFSTISFNSAMPFFSMTAGTTLAEKVGCAAIARLLMAKKMTRKIFFNKRCCFIKDIKITPALQRKKKNMLGGLQTG